MGTKHLEQAIEKLSANNTVAGLPGRETHTKDLYHFIYERLKIRKTTEAKQARVAAGQVVDIRSKHMNKTIFVCGVPGTGKTATVLRVVEEIEKLLKKKPAEIHPFKSVYINGQTVPTPEKIYPEILLKLTGKLLNKEAAQDKLNKLFRDDEGGPKKLKTNDTYKIIIIDELDLLYNPRRQSVFYDLFDWPTTADSKMLLIAIANAMDLPERLMRGRIGSRLGWEKIVFESYTSDCLKAILTVRLGSDLLKKCFEDAAIIVATKRIGRTTGDARRILDTCTMALDKTIQEGQSKVTPAIIDQVGFQNLDSMRRMYVTTCPALELFTLKSILIEITKVGEENVTCSDVYTQLNFRRKQVPFFQYYHVCADEFFDILATLAGVGLIYLEANQDLFKKRLYLKDTSEAFKDLINRTGETPKTDPDK